MKRAFTMLELVVVIVVIGILAMVAIPRMERDNLAEAVDQIVSHIRYTQHLAMQDNKFINGDNNWPRRRWSILFSNANVCRKGASWKYNVYFDTNAFSGGPNSEDEVARDPQDPTKFMSAGWAGASNAQCRRMIDKYNIGERFGITRVAFGGACGGINGAALTMSFDEFGRPTTEASVIPAGSVTVRPYQQIIKNNQVCTITISANNKQAIINIAPETGFVTVTYP